MAKKKKNQSIKIPDFFGTCNTYRIFALKSELSAFPFANELGKIHHTTFSVLPYFEYASKDYSAHYTVFYAELSKQESIHCLLLENKAIIDQQQQFISKIEKTLHFQTGFLFEEWLYIFNNQKLCCFNVELIDVDYLLLLYAKKEIENGMFSQFLTKIAPFKAQDISYFLTREQTSAQAKIVSFLRDFYCKYEIIANNFSRKRKANLLAPIQQIPIQNLQSPIPIRLENEAIADNLQLTNKYLYLLMSDE